MKSLTGFVIKLLLVDYRKFFHATNGLDFPDRSAFLLKTAYQKYNVEKRGSIVKMRIEKLPASCIDAKIFHVAFFSYNGVVYEHKIRNNYCEAHHVGELVDMKMLEDSGYILFPEESALFNLISCFILSLFGLFLILKTQWKDEKKV